MIILFNVNISMQAKYNDEDCILYNEICMSQVVMKCR